MRLSELASVERKLSEFIGEFSEVFGRSKERCQKCGHYVCGLLLDGERKSIEPMAARLPQGNAQALQQFVTDGPWESDALLGRLREFMLQKLKPEATGSVLILDDTSLPKQGKSSVGVNRQYCGALGKIANCQVLVSWQYGEGSARQLHFPLAAELFLPEAWTHDPKRMDRAKVPASRRKFQEKWRIALALLDEFKDQVPHEACLFDAGYGEIREFLGELDARGEPFIAQIPENHGFWPADVKTTQSGRGLVKHKVVEEAPGVECLTARRWAEKLSSQRRAWRSIPLPGVRQRKEGRKVQVAAVRVLEKFRNTHSHRGAGPERWLLIEKYPDGSLKYLISSLPAETPVDRIIQLAHRRYQVEQGYQQLKEELGLDHYEGRLWKGLHHHVSLCLMAFDFLVLLQQDSVQEPERESGKKKPSKKTAPIERPVPPLPAGRAA